MSKTWLDVSETWLEEPPTAECSACHRQTWDADSIGVSCGMPQPDGSICGGVFTNEARVRRYGEAVRNLLKIFPTAKAPWEPQLGATEFDIARAVIAVADEEQAARWEELKELAQQVADTRRRAEAAEAEVERLTRECLDREATEIDARERLRRCEERLAAVEALHVRTPTDAGPDYCPECSEAAQEWVRWPCPTAAAVKSDQ